MSNNKTKIIFSLFAVLAVLYAVNIYLTKNVSGILIKKPAKLSFMTIEAPKDQCQNCFDANNITKMIDSTHNIKYKSNSVPYSNALSQKYIEKYNIKNLPAVVVSGDIKNENVLPAWKALSGKEKNGRIVIEDLLPYYDIVSGKVKGVINAILIKDETCKNCFNENEYINILGRFGMVIGDTKTYDISSKEGEAFVQKYEITKIPTLILSPDAGDYPGFISSWKDVGTIGKDGWFIFREVQKLNLQYKKL